MPVTILRDKAGRDNAAPGKLYGNTPERLAWRTAPCGAHARTRPYGPEIFTAADPDGCAVPNLAGTPWTLGSAFPDREGYQPRSACGFVLRMGDERGCG